MDIIISVTILIIVSLSVLYIYKAKKKGNKCIGCPYQSSCEGMCHK